MRVAVTGGNGVLGCALRDLRPNWMYFSSTECDVTCTPETVAALHAAQVDVVLHAAALTNHQHPDAAEIMAVNAWGTQNVARICKMFGLPLVYTSTHYVYPGETGGYCESDNLWPIGAYAFAKMEGEDWVRELLPQDSLVVRGSWYTRETRLDKWAQRGALVDAYCSREPVANAARKIVALVEAQTRGVVNIGGARRSFAQILKDEGYVGFRRILRELLNDSNTLPYEFPADTSVSTAKFDALGLDWRNV